MGKFFQSHYFVPLSDERGGGKRGEEGRGCISEVYWMCVCGAILLQLCLPVMNL